MKTLSSVLAVVLALSFSSLQPVSVLAADNESGDQHARRLADGNDVVFFNTNSKKYHSPTCMHVKRCTHCIRIKRSEAKAQGGVPCKTCGANE